ncbi:hypothetical protein MnTg02_00538 [bacterium MnTg02]|nr:hypothetical protein MnTg02_00538 [bacterium MnTg02]
MTNQNDLRRHPARSLDGARDMAHKAVQLVTKAARANLTAEHDDSHSNLGWKGDLGAFVSQPLPGNSGDLFVGLNISRLSLMIVSDGQAGPSLELAGVSDSDAGEWLDGQLAQSGLRAASPASLPYDLPASAAGIKVYATDGLGDALATLSAWFSFAEVQLERFAASQAQLSPGPSPVRCWPHHFDIATYVGLEAGGAETNRGIGVGMSPGDESYGQPYFYINPWPHLDADRLPGLLPPGHWHTQGFVGAIATAEEVLSLDNIAEKMPAFVNDAFAIGREKLGV